MPLCDFCGETAQSRCGKCKCVFYCNASCQKQDWKHHKEKCPNYYIPSGEAIKEFWEWFKKNQELLFHLRVGQDSLQISSLMGNALKKVREGLTHEFGVLENGCRDFVISADGDLTLFPTVRALIKAAPKKEYGARWEFTAFRPRLPHPGDVYYEGKRFGAEEVRYALTRDERRSKIGVMLFMANCPKSSMSSPEMEFYGKVGFIYLDQILGEYDVETHVGLIEFENWNAEPFCIAEPLSKLANEFDQRLSEKLGPKPSGGWKDL